MSLAVFVKQPAEIVPLGVDFREEMSAGEAISVSGSSVTIYDAEGNEIEGMVKAGSMTVQDDTVLQATIQGGQAGQVYKATFRAFVGDDKLLEHDITLVLQD